MCEQQFSAKQIKEVTLWCTDKHSYLKKNNNNNKSKYYAGFLHLQYTWATFVPVLFWVNELSLLLYLLNKDFC